MYLFAVVALIGRRLMTVDGVQKDNTVAAPCSYSRIMVNSFGSFVPLEYLFSSSIGGGVVMRMLGVEAPFAAA